MGQGYDQVAQDRRSGHFPGLLVQFDIGELRGAVDGNEQVEPIVGKTVRRTVFSPSSYFGRLNLSNINMEVADGICLERLLGRLVAPDLGQSADGMALKTAVPRRSRQSQGRRLERVEAFFATNDPPDRLLYARTPAATACAAGTRQ